MKKLPKNIKLLIALVIVISIGSFIGKTYNKGVALFNETKSLELKYKAVVEKQVTNFENYYEIYKGKTENAGVNKDVFIEVTNIIMTARKDGESLAWKWLTENQPIPYTEFTSFYHEISAIINERWKDNMTVEQEKQSIVQQHNTMIGLYPNNILNNFLKVQPLVYKKGIK